MPQPDLISLNVPVYNSIVVGYRNASYIANRVAPVLKAAPASRIAVMKKGSWFRKGAKPYVDGTLAPRSGFEVSYISVAPIDYAHAQAITDRQIQNAMFIGSPPINLSRAALEHCTDQVLLQKEACVATACIGATATWYGEVGGKDVNGTWAAGAGNTFLADIESSIEGIRQQTGKRANGLILSPNTEVQLKQEDTILERIKYVERGIVSTDLIAALLGLDFCVIGDAIYSTASEAADGDDFTPANVWEQNAGHGSAFLFTYEQPNPIMYRGACLQVQVPFLGGEIQRITRGREDLQHQDVYEVAESMHFVMTSQYGARCFTDTILT